MENIGLNFQVSSNMKLPVSIQLTSGPIIVPPVDFAWRNDQSPNLVYQLNLSVYPATPWVGDSYTLHLVYSDGTSEDVSTAVTGYFADLPTALTPAQGASGVSLTPTFTWSAPATTPPGPYIYRVDVRANGSTGNGWTYANMPSSQLSVLYNLDASGPALPAATMCNWDIEAIDANGNLSGFRSGFTTQ